MSDCSHFFSYSRLSPIKFRIISYGPFNGMITVYTLCVVFFSYPKIFSWYENNIKHPSTLFFPCDSSSYPVFSFQFYRNVPISIIFCLSLSLYIYVYYTYTANNVIAINKKLFNFFFFCIYIYIFFFARLFYLLNDNDDEIRYTVIIEFPSRSS